MINLKKIIGHTKNGQPEDSIVGATDVGRIRDNNEDAFLINLQKNMALVSDGMGGHNAGEIASQNAIKTIDNYFTEELLKSLSGNNKLIQSEITKSIQLAHAKIHDLAAKNNEYKGMGCTIVVVLIFGQDIHIGHVGDTRVYLTDKKKLSLLTTDHSYAMELVKAGKMEIGHLKSSPLKNQLSQALGAPMDIFPSYNYYNLKMNERMLLCTDGLWDTITDHDIFLTLKQDKTKRDLCKELINKANKAGGHDNITVVIIENPASESEPLKVQLDDKAGEYSYVFSMPAKKEE